MVIEFLMTAFLGGLTAILNKLPTVDITIPTGFMTWVNDVFTTSAYFLPLVDFLAMLGIWFFVVNFQIIWRFIQRIWDALPLT